MSYETHEPTTLRVVLTDMTHNESICVTIGGVAHYLHAERARELASLLAEKLREYNTGVAAANHWYGLSTPLV